jgi:hypothetical protein
MPVLLFSVVSPAVRITGAIATTALAKLGEAYGFEPLPPGLVH